MATARASTSIWRSSLHQYLSGRPLHEIARRTFASTVQRNNRHHLPTFEQSSSQELDALLTLIHDRILVTGSLNPQQRELVFGQKWRATLQNEPVYATVGGEEIQLHPYNRQKDLPNRWKSYRKALEMAATEEDWRNMVRMLEGYQSITAGKHMASYPVQHFIHEARRHNQIGKIWQCLRNVNATGMTLSDAGVAHAVFVGCISDRLRAKEYSKREVKNAWTRMTDLLQLMEMPGHCGGNLVPNDMRQQPWVLGVVVEVAALWQEMRFPDGDGATDELQKYVSRLLDCIARKPLNTLLPEVPESTSEGPTAGKVAETISKLLPLWNGLRLVEDILGTGYDKIAGVSRAKGSAASLIEALVQEVERKQRPDKQYLPVQTWRRLKSQ